MSKFVLTFCLAVMLVSVAALGADKIWTHLDPTGVNVWTGKWSTAANWDGGVPGAGDDAYLTNTLASYVVDMDDIASNFGILNLQNAGGKTVTLNLNADLGWDNNWAYLYARQGSVINVNGRYQLGFQVLPEFPCDFSSSG